MPKEMPLRRYVQGLLFLDISCKYNIWMLLFLEKERMLCAGQIVLHWQYNNYLLTGKKCHFFTEINSRFFIGRAERDQ